MVSTLPELDLDYLVQRDRVHSSIFTRQDIFDLEIEKLFHKGWVFVGHTSEIPEPGDYATKSIGQVSVILLRDEDSEVRLFINRCRHRGSAVCQYERGNSMFFTCPYHGFTYSSKGDIVGIPRSEAYDDSMLGEVKGLVPVPRMAVYRGFVFGSLSPEGITLDEHLGEPCKRMIDLFCDASPLGEVELRAGVQRHSYHGNWKQVGMDGYHAFIVHQSFFDMKKNRSQLAGSRDPATRRSFTRDLGQGHCMLDIRIGGGTLGANERVRGQPWFQEYEADMERAHGKERAQEIIACGGDPHMHVYPNMQIIDVHLRVIYPISPAETVIYMYPALLKGVPPELNESRLRVHEEFYGPASGGNPDDYEVFERVQLGMASQVNPWVMLKRGLHQEWTEEEELALIGTRVGNGGDEITQRGQMARWKRDLLEL